MVILTIIYLCKRFNVIERLNLKKVFVRTAKPAVVVA